MSKTTWLVSLLLAIGACGDNDDDDKEEEVESADGGTCYYSPQVDVPRADYDDALADDTLTADECRNLCNMYVEPDESGDQPSLSAPECIVESVDATLVTMRCRSQIGCA